MTNPTATRLAKTKEGTNPRCGMSKAGTPNEGLLAMLVGVMDVRWAVACNGLLLIEELMINSKEGLSCETRTQRI